jgi:hypothetical protein
VVVVVVVVVVGYNFFRIYVKGVIDFFMMQGGQDILFSC